MKSIKRDDWTTADRLSLEDNALKVVKESANFLVVAGPGAGKTELLAQKACFLLQTNICKFPHKILAISFKRDAAYNLKERVKMRSEETLARRFDSLTFDSFAKQLLDRFKNALPKEYIVSENYEIVFGDQKILDFYRDEDEDYFNSTGNDIILDRHQDVLPFELTTSEDKIRFQVWKRMLQGPKPVLSFKMIMRLAELLMNSNLFIKEFLQRTYHYVFLDEFQDTTEIQYSFFKSCFLNSSSLFTAVGDDKQRIMLWAGAQSSIFEDFIKDVNAKRIPLEMNFRCAPKLVTLLNHLTIHLLGKTDLANPSTKWDSEQGECSVYIFDNPNEEMQILFSDVQDWIQTDKVNPRDICILVKQQLTQYAGELIDYFNENGIKVRDENKLQDILTDDISNYIINVLYAAFHKDSGIYRQNVFQFLINLHTESEDEQLLRLENRISNFIKKIRKDYGSINLDKNIIQTLITEIIDFADKDRIRAYFPIYKNAKYLDDAISEIENIFTEYYEKDNDIISALDMLIGKDTIPVMTIHKSKGLEYHTIVFIGLEDGAFWSFEKQPDEDKCAFFVALSRAKERVVFTFSKERKDKYGNNRIQRFDKIEVLFQELENSGLVNIEERKLLSD
ncbi:ATP-dependent helicase [Fluviicola sp.]|uniref:UvrD-helicase domain-containing protein n=1 Tax=Flavobacteriales TaxID=200644 RepID=UPI002613745D|nr:ATP-dependent helicase [Fluviicola sp.]